MASLCYASHGLQSGAKKMELYEVMRTTFAAREFTDAPVTDEMIERLVENARFAPSGGNRQGWRVISVREQATRELLGELIRPTFTRYVAQVAAGEAPWNTVHPSAVTAADVEATQIPPGFVERLVQAPVLLLVLVDLSVVASFDAELDRVGVISGASVYPFVWNLLLAARNEGLGGTLTTFVTAQEARLKEYLGVPEGWAVAAMLPLGQPVKQLTKLTRKPVAELLVKERWDA